MSNKKQNHIGEVNKMVTAVQSIIEKINNVKPTEFCSIETIKKWCNEAKEMEKEQMWEYIKKNYCIGDKSLEFHRLEFEKYYNETYEQ